MNNCGDVEGVELYHLWYRYECVSLDKQIRRTKPIWTKGEGYWERLISIWPVTAHRHRSVMAIR